MRVSRVLPNIYRAEYDGLHDLAMAFVRIQEYYDGCRFNRQIFELDEFIDYWCRFKGDGEFTYVQRWNGYNVPGKIIDSWMKDLKGKSSLRREEKELLNGLKSVHGTKSFHDAYLMGVCEEEGDWEKREVTEHESAHAFYALNRRYRQKANSLVSELPKSYIEKAERVLLDKGYHREVYVDEIQAYLSTSDPEHGVLGTRTLKYQKGRIDVIGRLAANYTAFKKAALQEMAKA